MKDALLYHRQKVLARKGGFFNPSEYEGVVPELLPALQTDFLVPRTTKTDLSRFREHFGFDLPADLADYINLYWHSYICGAYDCMKQSEDGSWYEFDEGPVLFSVLRHAGETDDDVLFQKYGIINLTDELYEESAEAVQCDHAPPELMQEAREFISIGWTGYAAHAVLYHIRTGEIYLGSWRTDRVADDKPIAHSLSELIRGIYFPNLPY